MAENTAKAATLSELVAMSLRLGENPDLIILAEGNTSARVSETSFFVKASGASLPCIEARGFVEVNFSPVLELLDSRQEGDEIVAATLRAAKADQAQKATPSVETLFHAYFLTLPNVNFVGHVHAIAVNSILCSQRAEEIVSGRIFPDEIVVCGPEPVFVPYCDPGLPLAREIKKRVSAYLDKWSVAPKALLMQNHGLVALGSSSAEVIAICSMWEKTARVLLGTLAAGGPHYMTEQQVSRIHRRPDEIVRRQQIRGEELK
jgi:rhamnose utilization protein RhaD (predicted bifunctional aldolase and dehydrogenase)